MGLGPQESPVLKRIRSQPKRIRFTMLDLETHNWTRPYAAGFYDGKEYREFVDYKDPVKVVNDCLLWSMQDRYLGWRHYAWNGGNYDFLFLLRRLIRDPLWKHHHVEITPIQACMFKLEVHDTRYSTPRKPVRWVFVDAVRLLPLRLDDVGETFGIGRKVTLEMTYNQLAQPQNRATMSHYLKQDCVLGWKAVDTFQNSIIGLGGQVGATLPATAMDLFRRRFQRDDIYINRHFDGCNGGNQNGGHNSASDRNLGGQRSDLDNDASGDGGRGDGRSAAQRTGEDSIRRVHPCGAAEHRAGSGVVAGSADDEQGPCYGCAHDWFRQAYFGGRTEIFRMKGENLSLFDVNSMYPYCMLAPMPIGKAVYVQGGTLDDVWKNAAQMGGIVECEVEIPSDCYLPPLPVRHRGKLVFPTGRFRGVWDVAELELVPQVGGRIHKIIRSAWFEERPIFGDFVHRLYRFRKKDAPGWTKGMDYVAKILMNSLYGKWGMNEDRSRIVVRPKDERGMLPLDLESNVWVEPVRVSPQYVIPQIAVHVTALARRQLWRILWEVLQQGGRIYYCDTDSVVTDRATKLPTGGELGQLKLESQIVRAEFVLPKLYLVETVEANDKKKREEHLKVKAKGMGPGIRLENEGDDELGGQLSEAEFMGLVKEGLIIQRHRMAKFKESLREFARKATEFPRIVASPKHMGSQYDKRIVLPDYDTRPLSFTNL